jgi:hypothetical protein
MMPKFLAYDDNGLDPDKTSRVIQYHTKYAQYHAKSASVAHSAGQVSDAKNHMSASGAHAQAAQLHMEDSSDAPKASDRADSMTKKTKRF